MRADNTSGINGVKFQKSPPRWIVVITFQYQTFFLGSFKLKQRAINVRNEAEREILKLKNKEQTLKETQARFEIIKKLAKRREMSKSERKKKDRSFKKKNTPEMFNLTDVQ